MSPQKRLQVGLLGLRLGVFIVMLAWTIDKFVNPTHSSSVYAHFYGISIGHTPLYILGALELILLMAFVLGIRRRLSYGLVLILHGVSTLSSWPQYINPFEGSNLLFFAAWPMLAASAMLYSLRDQDRLLSIRRFG